MRGLPQGDLRTTLLAGFAFLAIAPMIIAVVAIVSIGEAAIRESTQELAGISRESLAETAETVSGLSREGLEKNGEALADLGSRSVRETSKTLMAEAGTRYSAANDELLAQVGRSDEALTRALTEQSRILTRELAAELIRLSRESNRELTLAGSKQAEQAIEALAERMVARAEQRTNAISRHIVDKNQEAARALADRLVADIEREPVVNFKTIASIFARGIASDKVAPLTDGYLAVVDMRGLVVASTRYPRGTAIDRLAIVKAALDGQTPEDTLIRFEDGKEPYLGVFVRRDDGGAVIFAYMADRARVDSERMQQEVSRTLAEMGDTASGYVLQQLAADRTAMRGLATSEAQTAFAELKKTSATLSDRAVERMQVRADKASDRAVAEMTDRAESTAEKSSEALRKKLAGIGDQAIAAMRPIGTRFAERAETEMREQAGVAVTETTRLLPVAADEAGKKAAARMAPEAERLADSARRRMWGVAAALVGLEIVLAILAALLLSGRIAAPILTAQRQAREEQERLNREMEIASRIQTSLMPPVPAIEGFDLAVTMTPAEEVGGDFVELLSGDAPGAFWAAVGDVSGHGLTPGLIMMMAQSTFNALAREAEASPKGVYDAMNRVLHQNIKDRLGTSDHMTLSVLRHDGEGHFVHSGAHLDLLVYRAATGAVERLETDGPWIGMLPDCAEFTTECRFTLAPDDVLLLYTDGLIEARDAHGEQWDMTRLMAALSRHADEDARAIQAAILEEALAWADRIDDDISMIVIKRPRVPAAREPAGASRVLA